MKLHNYTLITVSILHFEFISFWKTQTEEKKINKKMSNEENFFIPCKYELFQIIPGKVNKHEHQVLKSMFSIFESLLKKNYGAKIKN